MDMLEILLKGRGQQSLFNIFPISTLHKEMPDWQEQDHDEVVKGLQRLRTAHARKN